jgi:hypothetical protein
VAIGGKPSDSEPFGLWLVEIDGHETRRLTAPPSPDWIADFGPVFSPDGRRHCVHPKQGDQQRHLHPAVVAIHGARR